MLIIRDEQRLAFRQDKLRQFKKHAYDMLQQCQIERKSPRHYNGTDAAFRYGFLTESYAMGFIKCVWLLGLEFYKEHPWAKDILRNDALPPAEKLTRLQAGVRAEV